MITSTGLNCIHFIIRRFSNQAPGRCTKYASFPKSRLFHSFHHNPKWSYYRQLSTLHVDKTSKRKLSINCPKLSRKNTQKNLDTDDNPYYYRKRMGTCCKEDDINGALSLMNQAVNQSVILNTVTYNSYLYLVIKYDLFDAMIQCQKLMSQYHVTFDATTYSTLANGYSKMNDWATALSLLREMQSKGIIPKARNYNSLLTAAASCNQHQLVFDLLNEIKIPEKLYLFPDENIYNDIIQMCIRKLVKSNINDKVSSF